MTVAAALMSSASSTWQTPDCVLDLVRRLGPIALDPCTTPENPTKAKTICVTPEAWQLGAANRLADGLAHQWTDIAGDGLIYCNPPYGRGVGEWVRRCFTANVLGSEVVALLPARTDTKWWRFCTPPIQADAVCFWRGRLTFRGAPACAPFPSAIVYWGARPKRFADVFSAVGAIWS